jgi:hypothetical protein
MAKKKRGAKALFLKNVKRIAAYDNRGRGKTRS